MSLLFSASYGIEPGPEDDWFDPVLLRDTPLFVDPFLIFQDDDPHWKDAHPKLIEHFDRAFHLVADAPGTNSLQYRKALGMLQFHEPEEFCLGYTAYGVEGAGGGKGYARTIAKAMEAAISRGLEDIRHFEELGILEFGIGPDRISDFACNVLKGFFIEYTLGVAERHNIETAEHRVPNASFDLATLRWREQRLRLPTNPATGRAVLLVPRRFLRSLNVLNGLEWWDYFQADRLKTDINYEVLTHVDKKTIVEAARRNPHLIRQWVEEKEAHPADPYDFERDPEGVWQWAPWTQAYVKEAPLLLEGVTSDERFLDAIDQVVDRYRHFIENRGGWKLLWNDDKTEKREEAAQLAFYGIAQAYCEANDIVVDREVNLGKGPVDFKFSSGYQRRALLEVKKLTSGAFWDGVDIQLPSYMRSERCKDGWLLGIRLRRGGRSADRAKRAPAKILEVSRTEGLHLRFALVDAMSKKSASKE